MGPPPPSPSRHRRPLTDAVAGGVAGAVARLVVGPLDVLKIRFQVQLEPVAAGAGAASKYTGLGQAVKTIVREEGVAVSTKTVIRGGGVRAVFGSAPFRPAPPPPLRRASGAAPCPASC